MENKSGSIVQNNGKKSLVDQLISLLIMIAGMYLLSGLLLLLLSAITYYGNFSGKVTEIGILIIYVLVCFLGGFLMGKRKKSKRFLWGMGTGAGYFLVILLVSLAMNGFVMKDGLGVLLVFSICTGTGTIGGMLS